ncbi:MAG: OmpA family protein [Flavobacteriaceae bacterium]
MKTLKKIIVLLIIVTSSNVNAQFWKDLGKKAADAAEETVDRKIVNKTTEKTGEAMDTILNPNKKNKKHKKKHSKNKEASNQDTTNPNNKNSNNRSVKTSKDFISGTKVLYTDTFKNDVIGDFPVSWNTNSSGEVITFNNEDTRWLQFDLGEYTPDGITEIPENCTFEFDLTVSDNFDWYSDGITLNIIEAKDRRKDFTKWSRFSTGSNGVRLRLKPKNFEYKGETQIITYLDNDKIIANTKNNTQFILEKNNVHVALWRQKNRLRVYLNDQKIWDIPRAFGDVAYNSVTFNTSGLEKEHFYISNLRLAIAGEDMRHPLLETGHFETNEILFDINKATIKSSGFKILDDLGKVLEENPTLNIKIIGHTDSDGSVDANQILSEKRAQAIKEYLSDNFPIAGKRMKVIGKGESEPIESNETNEGKAKNRRVEFIKF